MLSTLHQIKQLSLYSKGRAAEFDKFCDSIAVFLSNSHLVCYINKLTEIQLLILNYRSVLFLILV